MKDLWLFSFVTLTSTGCSVVATRPLQEMAIADSAIRAAREVNADVLEDPKIPEIYRAAADSLYKAKKEYRLKNFDRAKKYAIKATVLAEKAEFEAIRAGGATPEAATLRDKSGFEGAPMDTNTGMGGSIDAGPPLQVPPEMVPEKPKQTTENDGNLVDEEPPKDDSNANEKKPSIKKDDKEEV